MKYVPELFRGKWKENKISGEMLESKLSIENSHAEGIVIRNLNPNPDMKTRCKRFKLKCHRMLNERIQKDSDEDFISKRKYKAIGMMNSEI